MRFSLAPVSIDAVPIGGTYDPFEILVDDGTHSYARFSTRFLFGAKMTILFDQQTCSLLERGPTSLGMADFAVKSAISCALGRSIALP